MATQKSARAIAARVLSTLIRDNSSLSAVLPAKIAALPDPRDRGLAQELCYGTLRWYHRLDAIGKELLKKPLKAKDADIHSLILMGFYQLEYMNTPPHAAVSATAEATRELGKGWAVKLVNGVLRQFQRGHDDIIAKIDQKPAAQHSHPQWLMERLRKDWPDQYQAILKVNNENPPMNLRVNQRHQSRDDYLQRLIGAGIEAIASKHADSAIHLIKPMDVHSLPGFDAGDCSVQDIAAQLVPALMDLQDGQTALDACAAPGGKTGHLLEAADLELMALDVDERRNDRVEENLQRLNLSADIRSGDAAEPGTWLEPGRTFDRILLDAPCSGTGVIRRHPDIKVLRRPTDIPALAERQLTLLNRLWPTLNPGGLLLYVTCSVMKAENSEVIAQFLEQHPDAEEDPIQADWGHPQPHGHQTLPGEAGMDGFYFARLRKQT